MRLHITTTIILLTGLATAGHGQQAGPSGPLSRERPDLHTLILEYDRSIQVLKTGLHQSWTPEQYTKAFNDPSQHLSACKTSVTVLLNRPHTVWDERPPFPAEMRQVVDQCVQQRGLLIGVATLNKATPTPEK